MYVAELDRPWTDTPFMFQGFMLSTQQQLDALKKYCATVIVDLERSAVVETPVPRIAYPERSPVEQEIGPAKTDYSNSRTLMRDVLSAVRFGRTLDAEWLKSEITCMTKSVLRITDALLRVSHIHANSAFPVL